MGRRLGVVLAVFAGLLLPTSALAAAPANDDVTAATVISALPFADTMDTSEATAAAGDLDCSGLEDTHTVWYAITPTTDLLLGLRTEPQFAAEVSTSVASGSPGSLSFLQCSFASTQPLDAKAGTTYYIQLASAGHDPGGLISFSVVQVDPVTITLSLDGTGRIDGGVVTVGGTLGCSRPLPPGSEVVIAGDAHAAQRVRLARPVPLGGRLPHDAAAVADDRAGTGRHLRPWQGDPDRDRVRLRCVHLRSQQDRVCPHPAPLATDLCRRAGPISPW